MSKSLWLEYEPVSQPASKDPVERMTWCALRIRIGERFVTRVWDKSTRAERMALYVPAFPIAEWIAANWWFLWNEGKRQADSWNWGMRHCLRGADSALLLPALSLFNDGKCQHASWVADLEGALPHMPAEFVSFGDEVLDPVQSCHALSQFVSDTLDRVRDLDVERVRELRSLWRAIRSADKEETDFCRLSGRVGVDPYNPDEMTDELAKLIVTEFQESDSPLVTDLLDVAEPSTLGQQWQWINKTNSALGLGPRCSDVRFPMPKRDLVPPQFGYELARTIRNVAELSESSRVDSIERLSEPVLRSTFRVENMNHVPGTGIKSLIGQTSSQDIVAAGPQPPREEDQRFLAARSLYQAVVTSRPSQRLVTDSLAWDQRASRAFAAELLAPQQALKNRVSHSVADQILVEELAKQFGVRTIVIEKQLENVGIAISTD